MTLCFIYIHQFCVKVLSKVGLCWFGISTHFVDILSDQSFVQKCFMMWWHQFDVMMLCSASLKPFPLPTLVCSAARSCTLIDGKQFGKKLWLPFAFVCFSSFPCSKIQLTPYLVLTDSIPSLLSDDRVSKVPKVIQVLNWKSLIRQLTARNGDMFNMNLLCPELILAATAVCQLIMIVIRLGCTLRSPIITQ